MNKIFTIIVMLYAFSVNAQDFEITPDIIVFDLDGSVETNKVGYALKNNTADDLNWYWTVDLEANFPKDWEVQVCDQTLCWDFGTLIRGIEDDGNLLLSNSETNPDFTYINVNPNGTPGTGIAQFCIYRDKEYTDEVLCTSISTSVVEGIVSRASIYPNPTSELAIIEIDNVEASKISIKVVDINGKIIENQTISLNHKGHVSHTLDVSSYDNGSYIVYLKAGEQQTAHRISVVH